ncbi:hypothetical protein FC093_01075 [Ilyomonas limi]|uniref:Uncharacterized protein n=1 Tax=Ilyomonas limi TaxID=2575867 RepID=A0A4U3LCN3_9BACT|nr:hypothetical protein [Ilyomonas limi]TKK71647.1 hypothetical protein FC093_01075 [Ilyomonas limi]
MAKTTDPLFKQVKGTIGKQIVIKQYGDTTVISKHPDMSRVKPSKLQQNGRKLFAEAVAYARAVNRNPEQKATYIQKVPCGQSVYHYALKEYLEKNREG